MLSPSSQVLDNTVSIWPAIKGQDRDGGPTFSYAAEPASLGVACSCQPRDVEEMVDELNRITEVLTYHVFFAADPGVKPRDKMTFVDTIGNTHTLFVRATRNEAGRNAVWVVRAIEQL